MAKLLGVKTHIHYHVGREIFATNFVRLGGKVEVLQKLIDHEGIKITMKYVHMDNDIKRVAIAMMEAMDAT